MLKFYNYRDVREYCFDTIIMGHLRRLAFRNETISTQKIGQRHSWRLLAIKSAVRNASDVNICSGAY